MTWQAHERGSDEPEPGHGSSASRRHRLPLAAAGCVAGLIGISSGDPDPEAIAQKRSGASVVPVSTKSAGNYVGWPA